MSFNEAPIKGAMVDDDKRCTPLWAEFFGRLDSGDVGTSFTPTFTGLTTVGTPTISGVYYQNQGLTYFAVKIVPGSSTTSVFGGTTFSVPFGVTADTSVSAAWVVGINIGVITTGKMVYCPSWTAVPSPVTITGLVKS